MLFELWRHSRKALGRCEPRSFRYFFSVTPWLGIFSTNLHEFIHAQALLLAIRASLLAAIYPAWRISRMQPAAALRGE
jgi:hypothetical protein